VTTAVVVGGGPNGLTAAVQLAAQGIEVQLLEAADPVGGGLRSSTDLTVPGLVHDHCAAINPMGAGSPFLSRLDLDRYGLRWRWPEIDCTHPLDHDPAALLYRSLAATAAGLGGDETRWRSLFEGPVADFEQISSELLRPIVHLPRHPLPPAKFGMKAVLPAAALGRWFRTPRARALFGGIAAHAFSRLDLPASSAVGLMIAATGHRHGSGTGAARQRRKGRDGDAGPFRGRPAAGRYRAPRPAPRAECSTCSAGRGGPRTPMRSGYLASSCVPRPPHRARARTVCVAGMPRSRH
jgi:phytoene dehydrogenase-like protein